MTFSYADAMRKQPQQTQPAKNNDAKAQPLAPSEPVNPSRPETEGSRGPPAAPALQASNAQPSPRKMAWGKEAASVINSKPAAASSTQKSTDVAWGKSNSSKQKPPPIQILSKPAGKLPQPPSETAKKSPKSTNLPKSVANKPKSSATAPQSNLPKKSKKPQPRLRTMVIGDLMSSKPRRKEGSKVMEQPQNQDSTTQRSLELGSTHDFPTLAAAPPSNPTAKRGAWGTKAPPPVAAPVGSVKKGPASKNKNNPPPPKKSKGPKPLKIGAKNTTDDAQRLASSFFAGTMEGRAGDGEEHQLLRMVHDRKIYQKKGRQRLTPRKKQFTALKKKVLQERLRKWRELHPEEAPVDIAATTSGISSLKSASVKPSCLVCIYGFTQHEELEDDDEYNEIVDNLREMGTKIGPVDQVHIPRDLDSDNLPVFVKFQTFADAAAAKACWDGLVVGGERLDATLTPEPDSGTDGSSNWSDSVLAWEQTKHEGIGTDQTSTKVVLENVLTEDDHEDEECMQESLHDIREIVNRYGTVLGFQPSVSKDGSVEIVYQGGVEDAQSIVAQLSQVQLAGAPISAHMVASDTLVASDQIVSSVVILENALTDDDLEDEDCLQESLQDLRELVERHGTVSDIQVEGTVVKVTYSDGPEVALQAAKEIDGLLLGGNAISARIYAPDDAEKAATSSMDGLCIYLGNILTEDDLEDEDCLAESLHDLRELAAAFGDIVSLEVIQQTSGGIVQIQYIGSGDIAETAVKEFDGMLIGGQIISASIRSPSETKADPETVGDSSNMPTANTSTLEGSSGEKRLSLDSNSALAAKKARTDDVQPLYSGDKLIPERFAECKRAPKIPNSNAGGPREYAKLVNDEQVKPLLSEMLGELMRLQKRAIEEKNTKAKRRLVMGLREVARGIRSHKVKMVVMANNLDEYGVIDEKLQEIIDLAQSEDVPLFFEFTKRSLGKAVGKSIKIAVIGIQNADGAHQPFKKLTSLAAKF
jgi:ribosomal protein L7Ae-like RNA K-turn-binding protein